MHLAVDHVTLAASRLEALAAPFAAAGLHTTYGGMHSNGVTHMSLLGMDDGSYIELISNLRPQQPAPKWQEHIVSDAGPCAWAARSDDLAADSARLRALGVSVGEPIYMHRSRPDETVVEWDVAYVGDDGPGAMHPFLIADRTARDLRVSPSECVHGTEVAGVSVVLLAVADAARAADSFSGAYDLPPRRGFACDALGGDVLGFERAPPAFVAADTAGGWVAERVGRLGATPCGFLLGTRDLAASRERFGLGDTFDWDGRGAAWFDGEFLRDMHLGVVEI